MQIRVSLMFIERKEIKEAITRIYLAIEMIKNNLDLLGSVLKTKI